MLTRHFMLGEKFKSPEDILSSVLSDFENIPYLRIKIEQDSGPYLPITKDRYVEVHMLCPSSVILSSPWVRSKNPKNVTVEGDQNFFYNRRIYEGPGVEEVIRNVFSEIEEIKHLGVKFEQVVYDSNSAHDSWWA